MPSATPTPTGIAEAQLLDDLELAEPPPRPRPVLAFAAQIDDPLVDHEADRLPGSHGEHLLQCAYGSRDRAKKFYDTQVLDHLNDAMAAFIRRMDMAFIASADAKGECDSSFRAGPPGFIQVLDERHIAYPEYRGNGVLASLGNISENPHLAILMVDFVRDLIGLHVNGVARVVDDDEMRAAHPEIPAEFDRGRTPERWVVVEVEEAYIHCRKHIPHLQPVDRNRDWGTDDTRRKGGDYFEAKGTPRPRHQVVQTSGQ
ncbi:putative pyridoxine 5'-phosphate oxidase superfamily flavin-nucleotide-binding protein [Kibdelosporangium banguiense]|uniref:Pyridoxine 5'-phosphate oxidase superfamily flavin-nucleotide-binding protein n=1 Tax=Kibdelosporangium banguiense TaxID=1365924 RepID=A0ABS4TC54_9PSEU|nr:pyridoxamine 5'-phosphate oxidase family protein [Kibdelosporangium banguiense]MBP2322012.1 putative pyridoxine 5'-phosphate oxidase superfamily flavin-nucleotide-binding protein [Kibdelosporangium banguiense]